MNDDNKKPNCKMKTIDIGWMPHLCLFAIKDITPGEEVTFNYGDADWPWHKQVHEHIMDNQIQTNLTNLLVFPSNDENVKIRLNCGNICFGCLSLNVLCFSLMCPRVGCYPAFDAFNPRYRCRA